jgi:hypothetical protein
VSCNRDLWGAQATAALLADPMSVALDGAGRVCHCSRLREALANLKYV